MPPTPKPIAIDGCTTDHGGTVEAVTTKSYSDGKLIVTVEALHHCPIDGHGTTQIVSGSSRLFVEGKAAAREGDTAGCGATIISGCSTKFFEWVPDP